MSLASQAIRYGAVGVVNTVVGLTVIYGFMALGVGDVAANALGYAVGLIVSFRLNAMWTFRHRGAAAAAAGRFALVTAVAYAANVGALLLARDVIGIGSHAAQLVGVLVYACIGFLGSRAYAFRQ